MFNIFKSKLFINGLRWSLRFHGFIHIFELVSAVYERAFITAVLVAFAGSIEIIASYVIPHEHLHFKGIMPTIHEECDEDESK